MISPISMTNSVNFTGKINRTVYDYNPNDPTMARMPRTIKKAETPEEPVKSYSSGDPSKLIKVVHTSNGVLAVHPLILEDGWHDEYGVTGIPVVIDKGDGVYDQDYSVTQILTSDDAVKEAIDAGAEVGYISVYGPSQNTIITGDTTVAQARKMIDPKYDRYSNDIGKSVLAQASVRTNGNPSEGFRHSFNGDDVPDILTEKPNKRPAYGIKNPIESPCRYDNRELAQTYGRGSGKWHLNA